MDRERRHEGVERHQATNAAYRQPIDRSHPFSIAEEENKTRDSRENQNPLTHSQIDHRGLNETSQPQFQRRSLPNQASHSHSSHVSHGSYTAPRQRNQYPYQDPQYRPRNCFGILNYGANCYVNAALQCLMHTPQFRAVLEHKQFKTARRYEDNILVQAFANFLTEIESGNREIDPMFIFLAVSELEPRFSLGSQQDSHEFLHWLMNGLSHEIKVQQPEQHYIAEMPSAPLEKLSDMWWEYEQKCETSPVTEIFRGQLKFESFCKTCGQSSYTFESFLDLSLPLPKSHHCQLLDCYQLFTEKKMVSDHYCEYCRRECMGSDCLEVWRWPPILVIHLKRFGVSSYRAKKYTNVDIPEYFYPPEGFPYELYAVIHHIGQADCGHYYAECKLEDESWYCFNDTHVSKGGQTRGNTPYVLFYKRCNG